MTDRSEIETRVKKVLAEQLAVDEAQVVPDARFAEDLNADSLDLVEAVLALEEEWSIEIPEDEMESVKTVGQADRPRRDQARRLVTRPTRRWTGAFSVSERRRVVITGIGPVTPVGHRRRRRSGAGSRAARNGVRHDRRTSTPSDLPVTRGRLARRLRSPPTTSTRRRPAAPTRSRSTRSRARSSRGPTPALPRCDRSAAA